MKWPQIGLSPYFSAEGFISALLSYAPITPKDLLSLVTAKLKSNQEIGCYVVNNTKCFTLQNMWTPKSFKTPQGSPKGR